MNGLTDAQRTTIYSLDIGSQISVTKSFPNSTPSTVTQLMALEGISHDISPDRHIVTLYPNPARIYTYFIVGGYTTTTTRINHAQNPNFETNTSFYSADSGNSISRITTDSFIGTACLQVTATGSPFPLSFFQPSGSRVPMGAGITNTLSMYVKVPSGSPSIDVNVEMRCHSAVTGGSVTGQLVGATTTITSAMGWTRLSVTGTTPASTQAINIRTNTSASVLGAIALYDAILLESTSSALPYFDGTYVEPYTGYTLTSQGWSGTADASTSTATWGLTSSFVGSELNDVTKGLG
jgi:hypothetical protein